MNANEGADETLPLSVAAAISRGSPVDWSRIRREPANPDEAAVMAELRLLESISRVSGPAPLQWGPFIVAEEIGRGSFGTVYRATDPNLDLEVALKVIRFDAPGVSGSLVRALNEARLLARITHPNVVRVYRAEHIGNEVGLSMELVRGQTLADLVRRQGPFSASEAIVIGQDLCRALAAVHGAGLLHGDIKAHNVMRAEGGRTVLMDFGAGRDTTQGPRSLGDGVAGTPLYLAPEVFAGRGQTRASDIYSLGVLLYYLVTGSYPVQGRTRVEIARRHLERSPRTDARAVRPDLPGAFIRVLDVALAENPDDRYQSAGELEAALDQVGRPLQGPGRWLRTRKQRVVAGAVAAAALLLTAITMSGVFSSPVGTDGVDYRIQASIYRAQEGTDVRLPQGARVSPGDRLFVEVRASVPTHVYVVNEDDHGESYLLFPLPGQSVSNPLAAGVRHQLPGIQNGERTHWQVTSVGGHEHFVILASPGPPTPAFERLFERLPRPTPGKPVLPSRLSAEARQVLRGVGGLASAPAPTSNALRLLPEFAAPLREEEEGARGVWVRLITLDNPER